MPGGQGPQTCPEQLNGKLQVVDNHPVKQPRLKIKAGWHRSHVNNNRNDPSMFICGIAAFEWAAAPVFVALDLQVEQTPV